MYLVTYKNARKVGYNHKSAIVRLHCFFSLIFRNFSLAMAEDNDVIFEGQELQKYLNELGIKDFEVASPVVSLPRSPTLDCRSSGPKYWMRLIHHWFTSRWIPIIRPVGDEVLCKHIHLILECGLLFEDDVHFVINVLPNSLSETRDLSKEGCNSRLMNLISTLHWLCSNFWYETMWPITGSVVLCILWSWRKSQRNAQSLLQQQTLLQVMKDMYIVFGKSMKLIQENELILRGFTLAKTGSTAARLENSELPCMIRKWDATPGLRIAVANAFLEAIKMLTEATRQIIDNCPLLGQLDNPNHYMSYLDEKSLGLLSNDEESDMRISHLKRLHHVFLLLQSEFLRRLALCFCPDLWKWKSWKQIRSVIKTVSNVAEHASCLYSNLVKEYHVFYSYGICEKMQVSDFLPPIQKSEFLKNTDAQIAMRSASVHLQVLLLNTRALENKLETEKKNEKENLEEIMSHLSNIVEGLDACKSCCEEGIIQIKKLLCPVERVAPQIENFSDKRVDTDKEVQVVHVGYTDLDPQVEDEVFVAVITEDFSTNTSNEHDNEAYRNEQMQYETAKQMSQIMMQELKSILAVKAEKWREREAKALQGKQSSADSTGTANDFSENGEKNDSYVRTTSDTKENTLVDNVGSPSHPQSQVNALYSNSRRKESPQHKLLHGYHTESDCSIERCTDSPVSNVSSSSSQATSSKSPKHVYASETFRPLQNDLKFSVGLYLSSDALAKFQARNTGGSDTFSGTGEKSSSEESLVDEH